MRKRKLETYDTPWLLLCEGQGDQRLINNILERFFPDHRYQVEFVRGNGSFGGRLALLKQTSASFVENVKAVLIVSDKDDNESESFGLITRTLTEANFPIPSQSGQRASKAGYPDIVILMIPIRGDGNLETLCLEAMEPKWEIKSALDDLISSTPAGGWGIAKRSKARMGALLATICEQRPDTSFANHWDLRSEYHVPIEHSCFEEIVRFLKNFPKLIE